jgi:hypothetical protein
MSELFNCVNCGKQNIVMSDDPYDVLCEFPGKDGSRHPLRIKLKQEVPKLSNGRGNQQGEPQGQETTPAPLYEGKPPKYVRGKRKWARKCKECENSYTHDEQLWCESKRCPHRCPPKFRPTYRPNIELKGAPPAVSIKRDEPASKKGMVSGTVSSNILPPLPAFENTWFMDVQIEWFRSRVKLEEIQMERSRHNAEYEKAKRFDSIMAGFSAGIESHLEKEVEIKRHPWLFRIFSWKAKRDV